jgi:DNA-directed RNA polymerase specialized sigma24 family protein
LRNSGWALAKLPPDQREALILVGASGFSHEEAAAICETAVTALIAALTGAAGFYSRVKPEIGVSFRSVNGLAALARDA